MSLLTVQQKLELEQKLKMQQQENRLQMRRRENLVYGLKAADYEELSEEDVEDEANRTKHQGLIFRWIIAIACFVLVCVMKYSDVIVFGLNYETIIESLGNTDFTNGIDFTGYITYTDN